MFPSMQLGGTMLQPVQIPHTNPAGNCQDGLEAVLFSADITTSLAD